jgi:hypothetical protein
MLWPHVLYLWMLRTVSPAEDECGPGWGPLTIAGKLPARCCHWRLPGQLVQRPLSSM